MKKDNINKKLDYLIEAMDFMKDNAASKVDLSKVEENIEKIDTRLTRVEALMVTKDYLDDKLADLRGDLVVMTRKEDAKVKCLVEILQKKKLLTANEAKQIFTMEPFAQMA